jgi:chromosome segregation ATPase
MSAAEITAIAASLASLGGVLKILFDSRRREKRHVERLGDAVYERLHEEIRRLDSKIEAYEQRHDTDQRRIVELETGRLRRELQIAELSRRISTVDSKVDVVLQTGVFAKFQSGELDGDTKET